MKERDFPDVSQGETWSIDTIINIALVAGAVGCGIKALMTKNPQKRQGLLTAATALYCGQLFESFCSKHWGLLNNQKPQNEAYATLKSYQTLPPSVT